MINDEQLIQEFVTEGLEHLAGIEPDLLVLETGGPSPDPEVINRIFRAIHSIKGASGFFGFEALKALSHAMENVLMLMRDGKLQPETEIVNPLLAGTDRLRDMLDDIHQSGNVACQDVIDALQQVLAAPEGGKGGRKNGGKKPAKPVAVGRDVALRQGKTIYAVDILWDALVEKGLDPLEFLELIESVGLLLDSEIDPARCPDLAACLEAPLVMTFTIATVLEGDLLAHALGVEDKQVRLLESGRAKPGQADKDVALDTPPPEEPAYDSAASASTEPAPRPAPQQGKAAARRTGRNPPTPCGFAWNC